MIDRQAALAMLSALSDADLTAIVGVARDAYLLGNGILKWTEDGRFERVDPTAWMIRIR